MKPYLYNTITVNAVLFSEFKPEDFPQFRPEWRGNNYSLHMEEGSVYFSPDQALVEYEGKYEVCQQDELIKI